MANRLMQLTHDHGEHNHAAPEPEDEEARRGSSHGLHDFENERCRALSAHFGDLYTDALAQNVADVEPFDVPDISLGMPHASKLSSVFYIVNDLEDSSKDKVYVRKEHEEEAVNMLLPDPQDPDPRSTEFTGKDMFLAYVSTDATSTRSIDGVHQLTDGCDVLCHANEGATMEKEMAGKRCRSESVGMDTAFRCRKLMKGSDIDDDLVASQSHIPDVRSLGQDEDEERPLKPISEREEEIVEAKNISPGSLSLRTTDGREEGTEQNLCTSPLEQAFLQGSGSFEQAHVRGNSSVEEVLVEDGSSGKQAPAKNSLSQTFLANDDDFYEQALTKDCSIVEQGSALPKSFEETLVLDCSPEKLLVKDNRSLEQALKTDDWNEKSHLEDSSTEQSVLRCSEEMMLFEKSLDKVAEKTNITESYSTKVSELKLVPESVLDVVLHYSGYISPPRLDDPDLLSLVMGSGVFLALPFRDCSGKLIEKQF